VIDNPICWPVSCEGDLQLLKSTVWSRCCFWK
jgi:hypothetical protein